MLMLRAQEPLSMKISLELLEAFQYESGYTGDTVGICQSTKWCFTLTTGMNSNLILILLELRDLCC